MSFGDKPTNSATRRQILANSKTLAINKWSTPDQPPGENVRNLCFSKENNFKSNQQPYLRSSQAQALNFAGAHQSSSSSLPNSHEILSHDNFSCNDILTEDKTWKIKTSKDVASVSCRSVPMSPEDGTSVATFLATNPSVDPTKALQENPRALSIKNFCSNEKFSTATSPTSSKDCADSDVSNDGADVGSTPPFLHRFNAAAEPPKAGALFTTMGATNFLHYKQMSLCGASSPKASKMRSGDCRDHSHEERGVDCSTDFSMGRLSIGTPPSLPTSPYGERRAASALNRPTKHVYKVDSVNCDVYVKLNQYKLTREIGQGSYGIVKLAYNEEDNNHYAMKILDKRKLMKKFAFFKKPPPRKNKQPSSVPDPLGQAQREIAILKKLSHPNVVRLVEVLEDSSDNYLYMVFEYVERGCVMELPTPEPLTENLAWTYFRDTLMGLEYLHFHKIIHRDIKPSNLLLTESGHVKIADFGVSSEFEGLDAILTGTAGTPAFMAPEALIEDASHFYGGRAQDIWSLGVTLFSFIYGRVPFWDPYVIALHRKIKIEPLAFPQQPVIKTELSDLIESLLNKNPVHRLTLSAVKIHPWVTKHGKSPLPSEEENCQLVTVTEDDIRNSVKTVPRLDTLILIKAMGHRRHFGNPFKKSIDLSTPLSRFVVNRCSSVCHDINKSRTGEDLYAACTNIQLKDLSQVAECNDCEK